ncbi:MAG: DUF2723 domain-containing protein [Gemmatimonadota bacterium]
MTARSDDAPPYKFALLTTAIVLIGYLATLAPSVTFWDAGEFIAAAKILGIPHPPGTPLFVLIGHTWGKIFPFGEYAFKLNLLSATFSAFGAGAFFLVVHESLARFSSAAEDDKRARLFQLGGAMAAAIIAAFTFTNWQNSNETEVYAVGTFMAGALCWLSLLWRRQRGTARAPRTLWLMLYIAGLSLGNHLLTLLVGPGVVLGMIATLRAVPETDPARRRSEWAEVWVVAGTWVLLIGMGLGSTTLIVFGGLCFLAAAFYAFTSGVGRFALVALVLASIGITSYGYLFFRSQHHPMISEAQPDNLKSLLEVIQRKQYPVRTPLDDPTQQSGPGNPGRSASLVVAQFGNYFEYYVWQWGNGIPIPVIRAAVAILFFGLGLMGMVAHWKGDRPSWWLLFGVFLVTGLGLIIYMNFKPGFSLAYTYKQWPNQSDHEVRDRDYFFVISFIVWGLWAGIGLATWSRRFAASARSAVPAFAVLLVGLVPFAGNFAAASRHFGPDASLAGDFAYDLLNSVPPYGVVFTYGDNDTFPLWWAQEVEGIRQDVTVVCLALAQTDWYVKQLRDNPTRPFDEAAAPAIWKGKAGPRPTWPLHTMSDDQINQFTSQATVLREPQSVPVGPGLYTLPGNQFINPNQIVLIRVLQENIGKRPVSWSMTTGRDFKGLDPFMLQQGMAYQLTPAMPDTTSPDIDARRVYGTLLDIKTTEELAWHTYRYAGLLDASEEEITGLETTARGMAFNLGVPFTQLALAYQARGNREKMIANLERAAKLVSDPNIKSALHELRMEPFTGGPDSARIDTLRPRADSVRPKNH